MVAQKQRAVLDVVREIMQFRRTDRDYERSLRELERNERGKEGDAAANTKEIETSPNNRIALHLLHFRFAHQTKAKYEANGAPVPSTVIEFLAGEKRSKVLNGRWKNCFRDGLTGRYFRGFPNQSKPIKSNPATDLHYDPQGRKYF
ncbi:MAG: hypothetical protein H7343_05570 [Undibacterium sp.]|nr:hypothetical protein [Opitutaceae bacterium]